MKRYRIAEVVLAMPPMWTKEPAEEKCSFGETKGEGYASCHRLNLKAGTVYASNISIRLLAQLSFFFTLRCFSLVLPFWVARLHKWTTLVKD